MIFLEMKESRIGADKEPMAGKGDDIPKDNEPEEPLKFSPTWSPQLVIIDPDKQNKHAGNKKHMAYLMGDKPFGIAMLLHCQCRYRFKN